MQTGVDKSFTGCMREVIVNNLPSILSYPGGDILYGANVGECDSDPCQMNPCLNNGTCQAIDAIDFECLCINSFVGKSTEGPGFISWSRSELVSFDFIEGKSKE